MINIIAAKADNNVIGIENKLPWRLKKDMERFKDLTMNNIVIMGKKTYESISHPLEGRINIIVSSSLKDIDGAVVMPNFDMALKEAQKIAQNQNKQIFICGGQSVYQSSIHLADTLYITDVHISPQGDAYFPAIPDDFVLQSSVPIEDNGIKTDFCIYKRI